MPITTIKLLHGSGRGLNELLHEIIYPALVPQQSEPFEDAAILSTGPGRFAFTTDSFVVNPLEFPGGSIGTLAACGTINDLAMMGARPQYLSVALIIEEGMEALRLRKLLDDLRAVCDQSKVAIVCGDTKVVDHGKADGLFITTSGIGTMRTECSLSAGNCKEGDVVIVSGPVGRHGITILAARRGFSFASSATSDCAPLHTSTAAILAAVPDARVLRDATRGGVSAVLNEIARDSGITIRLQEDKIPVDDTVRGACEFLGMDPLHIANEGTYVAVVPANKAQIALSALRSVDVSANAAIIGLCEIKGRFPLVCTTSIGATRPVEVPAGELLPRIC